MVVAKWAGKTNAMTAAAAAAVYALM